MTSRYIGADEALAALEAVVAEGGEDYVYPDEEKDHDGMCRYVRKDGTPSCIVGHVVTLLDPELLPLLATKEGAAALSLGFPDKLHFTNQAAQVLDAAQQEQDNGKTWGEALAYARIVFNRRTS